MKSRKSRKGKNKYACGSTSGNPSTGVPTPEDHANATTEPECNETNGENDDPNLAETAYLDERKLLVDLEQKSSDQHDKAILTLAAGGLTLSITFLEKIAPQPLPSTYWLIVVSWVMFVMSLLFILGSFLTSQKACRCQRDILDKRYLGENADGCDEANRWSTATGWLTFTSYLSFWVAVVFLVCFAGTNFFNRSTPSDGGSKKAHWQDRRREEAGRLRSPEASAPTTETAEKRQQA